MGKRAVTGKLLPNILCSTVMSFYCENILYSKVLMFRYSCYYGVKYWKVLRLKYLSNTCKFTITGHLDMNR